MHLAEGIEFWIVRKGEDPYKVAPKVADEISKHPDNRECFFCGESHEIGAVIAFYLREPEADAYTAGIFVDCAKHDDEKLAERTHRVEGLREYMQMSDELEEMGFLETTGIDPITGERQRRITDKGVAALKARQH
jgi:hypothetical protein